MCGRFANIDPITQMAKKFFIDEIFTEVSPGYNIVPGNNIVSIVRQENKRLFRDFKWGLVPSWAKDKSIGYKMINARSETVAEKPSFKKSLKTRRCLIVANGFYEWAKIDKIKQPVYIHLKNQDSFTFAGLYDKWVSPEGDELYTCTILTTDSNEMLKQVHNRMPVIIEEKNGNDWLDVSVPIGDITTLLRPYPSDQMEFYNVSTFVNSPKNQGPDCIKPL